MKNYLYLDVERIESLLTGDEKGSCKGGKEELVVGDCVKIFGMRLLDFDAIREGTERRELGVQTSAGYRGNQAAVDAVRMAREKVFEALKFLDGKGLETLAFGKPGYIMPAKPDCFVEGKRKAALERGENLHVIGYVLQANKPMDEKTGMYYDNMFRMTGDLEKSMAVQPTGWRDFRHVTVIEPLIGYAAPPEEGKASTLLQ